MRFRCVTVQWIRSVSCVIALAGLAACTSYRTPGSGIDAASLSSSDPDIAELFGREPAAPFPARLALARVQMQGYQSASNACRGTGRYCMATTRDVESDADLQRLSRWPMISAIAPLAQMWAPARMDSVKDLRVSAAMVKADVILVYSLDTRFAVESIDVGPLSLISLGFLPNKQAHVTTTASAALVDVRSGFIFGVTEATVTAAQRASLWSRTAAIESVRLKTEAQAFQKLLTETETLWTGVVQQYVSTQTRF